MPAAEDGAGHCRGGKSREMGFGESCCQTGILHAHFYGKGHALFPAHTGEAAKSKAQGAAQQVMKNYDSHDCSGRSQDCVAACTRQAGDQQGNAQAGQSRQICFCLFAPVREKVTQRYAETDGNDNNLYDAPEHGNGAEINSLADNEIREKRGHNGRQQRGNRRHGYGKGQVTFTDKRNHVGSGTAGAGAYQYHAYRKGRVKIEGPRKQVCQKRHDGILGDRA